MEANKAAYYFWQVLENDIKTPIANHLKNAFHLCGFSNAVTFRRIIQEDIDFVENYVKRDLIEHFVPRAVPETDSDDDLPSVEVNLKEEDKTYFFGTYSSKPSDFIFLRGERKMLEALVEHVKSVEETVGLQHFQLTKNGIEKGRISWKGTFHSKIGMHFGDRRQLQRQKPTMAKISAANLEMDLFNKFQKFVHQHYNYVMPLFVPNMVELKILSDNNVQAKAQCVICLGVGKSKTYSIFCQRSPTTTTWIFSNLKRHMDRHAVENNQNLNQNAPAGTYQDKILDDANSSREDVNNTPLPCDTENDAYYQDLMFTQLSTQNLMMKNATLMHKETIENISFNLNENVAALINVTKMRTDGNCLFSALAHQIYCVKVNSKDHLNMTRELRQTAASFIQENFSLFSHDIKGRVLDQLSKRETNIKLKTENIDIDRECRFIVNICLPKQGYWGGYESLKAISRIYKINILVFSEDSGYNFADIFNSGYDRSVFIAFRHVGEIEPNSVETATRRNHYDSVVDISPEIISECSKGCADLLAKVKCKSDSDSIVSINDSF